VNRSVGSRIVVALLVAFGAVAIAAVAAPGWAAILAGFVLGVIGVGAGAVLQQSIIDGRRRRDVLRALAQELEENILRTGSRDSAMSPVRMSRSAWEAARALDLEADVFQALRFAYMLGEDLNSRMQIVDAYAATPIVGAAGADAVRVRSKYSETLMDAAEVAADETRAAFEVAREALRALV
jgi:hypothetical protein